MQRLHTYISVPVWERMNEGGLSCLDESRRVRVDQAVIRKEVEARKWWREKEMKDKERMMMKEDDERRRWWKNSPADLIGQESLKKKRRNRHLAKIRAVIDVLYMLITLWRIRVYIYKRIQPYREPKCLCWKWTGRRWWWLMKNCTMPTTTCVPARWKMVYAVGNWEEKNTVTGKRPSHGCWNFFQNCIKYCMTSFLHDI